MDPDTAVLSAGPGAQTATQISSSVCLVIPFYNHEGAIAQTLSALSPHGLRCYVVDDGSGREAAVMLDRICARLDWVRVLRRSENGGKGRAVVDGFRAAAADGYRHVVQFDADGQHDAADLARMLQLIRLHPTAVIAGVAQYDASAPRARRWGRQLTHFWVWVHTLSFIIRDSMCGFRAYPLAATLALCNRRDVGARMEFDTEVLVRLYWSGVDVVNLPTQVRYPSDGVSHFRMLRDNVRLTGMHFRLFFGMLPRIPRLLARATVRVAT